MAYEKKDWKVVTFQKGDPELIAGLNHMEDGIANASSKAGLYKFKGTKQNYSDLPTEGNEVGDTWNVVNAYQTYPAGTNWAWTGTEWDALGGSVDLSVYRTKADQDVIDNGIKDRLTTAENNITQEVNDRTTAINTVNNSINAEATTREQADSTLTTNINTEVERAKGIEAGLRTDLTNEAATRDLNDRTLITEINKKQDIISDLATIRSGAALGATAIQEHQSLAEYRKSADQDVIDNAKATVANLDTEIAARQLADSTLQNNIDTKQDKLTPGTNITIDENNVISATGGSTPTNMLTTDTVQTVSGVKTFTVPILFAPQDNTFIKLSAAADTYSDTLKLISGNSTGTIAGSTELQIFYNYNTGRKIIMPATDGDVELGRTGNQLKNIFVSGYIKDGDATGSHSISVAEMVAKQDKLTAGDNITIENNVISANVSGSAWTACTLTTTEPAGYPCLPGSGTYELLYKDGNIRYTFGTLFYDVSYPNSYGCMIKKAGEALYLQLKCASGGEIQIYPITPSTGEEGEMIDLHESGTTVSTKIFYRKLL